MKSSARWLLFEYKGLELVILSRLRVAKPQLIFAHVVHFTAPIAVRRSAANDEAHPVDDTTMPRNVNVNQL
jgi:hypothetical protein